MDTARVAACVVEAVPALLTVFLAFNAGGFFGAELPAALAVVGVAIAVAAVVGRRRLPWSRSAYLAVGATLALSYWILVSALWSVEPRAADTEAARALLYAGVLVLALLLGTDEDRAQRMLRWLTAAMVLVAAAALAARTLPDIYPGAVDLDPFGLNYPITYANGLALVAATAVVLCVHLTSSRLQHPVVRELAAGAVPLLVSVLVLTRSVGVALACIAAVAIVALTARGDQLGRGALAVIPGAGLTALVTLDAEILRTTDAVSADALAQGRVVAMVALACALQAGVVRRLVDRLSYIGRPAAWSRGIAIAALAAGLALALAGALADSPDDPSAASQSPATGVQSRIAYWDAALEGFADAPLAGSGAGSFGEVWETFGATSGSIRDAHSLYLGTLAELGLVGALLLLAALGAIGWTLFRLTLDRPAAASGALAATGALWLVVAAFEWVWELPAVSIAFFAVAGLALAAARRPAAAPRVLGSAPG